MRYYNRLCGLLCKALLAICSGLMAAILCCSALQVFSRYVLGSSFTWTEETARYCFIWLDMLGAAVLTYKGGHAAVDLFSHRLRGTVKKVYQTAVYFAVLYVGVIFVRYGSALSRQTFRQTSPSLKLPMGLVYGVIPACGVLVCVFAVNLAVNVWIGRSEESGGV